MRRALTSIVCAVGLVGAIVIGSADARRSTVYSIEGCIHPKPKPAVIVFYCADAGGFADGLTWTDWGGPSAHATGTLHLKSCVPNCLEGSFEDYPVEITLFNIQHSSCGDVTGRFYKNVRLSFPDAQPDFHGNPPRHVYCSRYSDDSPRFRHCGGSQGPGAGFFNVHTTNLKCPEGRHVARHVFKTGERRFNGWRCDAHSVGVEAERIDCRRRKNGVRQRVNFIIAA